MLLLQLHLSIILLFHFIVTIATRPTLTEKHLNSLILYTFSIPGLTLHTGPELCKILFISNGIFNKIITSLANEQQLKIIFNSLEGSYALVSFVLYFFKYILSFTKFL